MSDTAMRSAVIDIGSNSVRLVVYAGHKRIPSTIFNEKILAGLGSELATTGNIGEESFEKAMLALRRFKILCDEFRVDVINVIATAAVRDAANGPDFVAAVRAIGLDIHIINGHQEAHYSALGVMSAFPEQNGIMADLGGGSLEIAQIENGNIVQKISIPMGVLRVQSLFDSGYDALNSQFQDYLHQLGWNEVERPKTLFLVGGSWRALAHIDMDDMNYPLRVVDQYEIDLGRANVMDEMLKRRENEKLSQLLNISSSRIKTLGQGAALLRCVTQHFNPHKIQVSAFGLREGILFSQLNDDERQLDPLIVGTQEFAIAQTRFKGNSSDLNGWISDIFADDNDAMARIRHAFCNLGDVAWRANPDFRAEWGLAIGLHGSWAGMSGPQRDVLGQALYSCFGGGNNIYPHGGKLAKESEMKRAIAWGLGVRLAQRLSGGKASTLSYTKLGWSGEMLTLYIDKDFTEICGEAVLKRLNQLANALNCEYKVIGR